MEPLSPAAETTSDSRRVGRTIPLMAIGAISLTLLAIVKHWQTFDWAKKYLAIILVADLLLGPMFRSHWAKHAAKLENKYEIVVGDLYTTLLLFAVLFM